MTSFNIKEGPPSYDPIVVDGVIHRVRVCGHIYLETACNRLYRLNEVSYGAARGIAPLKREHINCMECLSNGA